MPPRKPLTLRISDLPIPNPNEVEAKIRELGKKLGYKPTKKVPIKGAASESAPGKPNTLA